MNKQRKKSLTFFIITFIFSFGLGALSFFLLKEHRKVNPDRVLEQVKSDFRADGPIAGSWIEMTEVPWSKHAYQTEVYYGGLSRMEGKQLKNYEFIADAHTGSLIDVYEI